MKIKYELVRERIIPALGTAFDLYLRLPGADEDGDVRVAIEVRIPPRENTDLRVTAVVALDLDDEVIDEEVTPEDVEALYDEEFSDVVKRLLDMALADIAGMADLYTDPQRLIITFQVFEDDRDDDGEIGMPVPVTIELEDFRAPAEAVPTDHDQGDVNASSDATEGS